MKFKSGSLHDLGSLNITLQTQDGPTPRISRSTYRCFFTTRLSERLKDRPFYFLLAMNPHPLYTTPAPEAQTHTLSHLASCILRHTREACFFLSSALHPNNTVNLTNQSSTTSKNSRHKRSFYRTPRCFEWEMDRQTNKGEEEEVCL